MASSNTISILIQAKDEASRVLRDVGDSFQDSAAQLKRVGSTMSDVGGSMTRSLTLPLAGLAAGSLKMAGDFEQSLNILQSVTGATGAQMNQLRDTARALGQDVSLPGVSARDAAIAMTELGKAGLSVNDTLAASKGVLSLAKAGQLDVGSAAMATAQALNAFGLAGGEANRIADLLSAAANASTASVDDMALGLQMAGQQSHQMGVTLQDTVAALSLFSNAGVRGSDAGTSLKQMFIQLATPTKAASELMQGLNLHFFDARGNFIGLSAMAQQLQDRLGGLSVEQRNAALATIFGSDATRVASILASEGAKGFNEMATAVNRQGAASELAAAQNRGFNGALDNLKSTAQTAMIDIGTNLLPIVTRALQSLTTTVSQATAWFSTLSTGQQEFIFKTLALMATVGPAILILGKFATALSSIVTVSSAVARGLGLIETAGVVGRLGAATSAMGPAGFAGGAGLATRSAGGLVAALGPLGVAVAAAAVVAGGAYLAYKHFNDIGNKDAADRNALMSPAVRQYTALAQQLGVTLESTGAKATFAQIAQTSLTNAQNIGKAATEQHDAAIQRLNATHQLATQRRNEVKAAQDAVTAAHNQFGANSPQYQAAVANLNGAQSRLNDALFQGAAAEMDVSVKAGVQRDALNILNGATAAMTNTQRTLNDILNSGVGVIARFGPTALAQVGGVATLQNAIGSMAGSWNNAVINIQNQSSAINLRLQGVTSNIQTVQGQAQSLNNTLSASNKSVQTLQGSMSLQGGRLQGSAPHNALGTNYAVGGRTLVGEHGPEYVDMPRGSKVYTAEESRNMSPGAVINNILSGNFTFHTADAVNEFFNRLDKTQRLARMGAA